MLELSPVATAYMFASSPSTSHVLSMDERLGTAALPLDETVCSIEHLT